METIGDLLIEGKVKNVEKLEAEIATHNLDLFALSKWNTPPLTVACVLGYTDIVRFLLENGANPNEQCTDEMNTPLHYACLFRQYLEKGDSLTDWSFRSDAIDAAQKEKEKIIKLLFDHGAVLERNSLGFLPIHCAALCAMEGIVDYFIMRGSVTDADRLLALEVLGVSLSVVLQQNCKAYYAFIEALLIRHDIGCKLSPCPSEVGELLKCKEFTTFKELHKLKNDKAAMWLQGLLVGERVLPEKLKQQCLWPNMMSHYMYLTTEQFMCACQYGLKLEMSSRLAVGTVLDGIAEMFFAELEYGFLHESLLIRIASCLEKYNGILMSVESEHLEKYDIFEALKKILRNLMWSCVYCPDTSLVRRTFDILHKPTISVIKIFFERTSLYENIFSQESSIAYHLFEFLHERYDPDYHLTSTELRSAIALLNHMLPSVLKYEHEVHRKTYKNYSILHMAMELLEHERDLDVVQALTHKLVRHGCSIEAKTSVPIPETAKDMALRFTADFQTYHPEVEEILALVSRPSEALSLQELTARFIIRSRIPYSRGIYPSTICDFLNGEDFW